MKRYKVYVYNTVDKFWDCYEVLAEDPVDARNVAVQRGSPPRMRGKGDRNERRCHQHRITPAYAGKR